MTIARIDNCGVGLNSDLTPEELGSGVWSVVENMRFRNGYAEKFRGTKQAFTTPVITPYFLTPYTTATTRFWVYAGLTAIYSDDGTTQTNITGTAPTGAIDDRWTGGSLNGVLVLNNGKDIPVFWGGTGTAATLTGWTSTWRAQAVRPFKNFIIALNITKSTTNYPSMVKWSDIAVPGAIPTSWDETNPALDAGEMDLAETPDKLVDCLPLGDVNIIYKERSMYAQTYIGAPYIFRFQRLPGNYGMLARGCAAATPLGHIVLSAGDVVLCNGTSVTSIANGAVRDYIFKNISPTYYLRSFVTANPNANEVWICFPFGDSATCNVAAVWNWDSKAWGLRTLSNVTCGDAGQYNFDLSTSTTWADPDTWDTDATEWNENELSPASARLVLGHTTPALSIQDIGTTDFGLAMSCKLERTGISFGDGIGVKTVRSLYPKLEGAQGAVVNIQVGASMYPDNAPTWGTAQAFTIGSTSKIDSIVTGRFLSVRFTTNDYPSWRIKSFDIDYVDAGLF